MSDRDMYIKQLEEKLTHVVRGTGKTTVCVSVLDLAIIVNLLKESQEQKHGHWIPIKLPTGVGEFGYKEYMVQEVTCSECKFTEDVSASAYLYCPNCGAKMDGKVKQDG